MMTRRRLRFAGQILGVGSSSGVRVVVGRWLTSPMGNFADVMVERRDGRRILLAPTPEVADFVSSTYRFDEVRIEPVSVVVDALNWQVRTPSLVLDATLGRRSALGWVLRLQPPGVASSPVVASLLDPIARVVLRGVRTRGSAGGGRREYYGASDRHLITAITGSFDGSDLGRLAAIDPPVRFGFSSTPPTCGVTSVTTTVTEAR